MTPSASQPRPQSGLGSAWKNSVLRPSVFQHLQFGSGLWHSAFVFETNASFVTADADLSAVDIVVQRESAHAFPVVVANWRELVEHRGRHGLFAADAWSRACHRLAG